MGIRRAALVAGRHVQSRHVPDAPPPRAREILGWIGAGYALAVVMTWPLALRLSTHVPQDLGDPLFQTWTLGWVGHALRHGPLHLFDANAFAPLPLSLAFSDSLAGYGPFAMVGSGVTAALVRYNLLFLLAYAVALAGAAVLARELGARIPAALVAGVAFAYAPWRLGHNGHLNILSIGGIPLAIALLLGGYRRRRPGRVLAGWLVATWQISLGFGLGIYFFYLLALLGLIATAVWIWRGRPLLGRAVVGASLVGVGVFAGVTLALVAPYRDVLERFPEARRDRTIVDFYSPPWRGYLAAPAESRVWGERTADERAALPWAPEMTLFPGLAVVVLAVTGLGHRRTPATLRFGLAAGTIAAGVLALGFRAEVPFGYSFLYEHLPGLEGLRTPGRLTVLTSLGLAVLAGLGVELLAAAASRERPGGRYSQHRPAGPATRAATVGAGLALLVAFEGSTALRLVQPPRPPRGAVGLAGPQFHLPLGPFHDVTYMYWSIDAGFPRIGNGYSGFVPEALEPVRDALSRFPDARSVRLLRRNGYRTVVLHPDRARGTPWERTGARPVDGLGITRAARGDVVVYDLTPGG